MADPLRPRRGVNRIIPQTDSMAVNILGTTYTLPHLLIYHLGLGNTELCKCVRGT